MFSHEEINKVCAERLDSWRKILVENDSTPFALVSIGHNKNQGEIHLCVIEDMHISNVLEIMKGLVRQLKTI